MERLDKVGDAVIYRGDPRLPKGDIDLWYNGLLGQTTAASARPWLYGSDAGLCPRKNAFYAENTWLPTDTSPATRTYMAIGVALENLLATALRERGRLIAQNPYLIEMPEVKVRGKIDLVVFDHQDELALIEVKSCGDLPVEPDPQHLAQIQTYSAISGIHKAHLTYISRKVQIPPEWGPEISIRTFPVPTDQESLIARLKTIVLSDLSIKTKKIPKVGVNFRKTLECRYCPFLNYCWYKEPRYGGGERDESPLEEMTTEEEIVLTDKAYHVAVKLYQESEYRRKETIKDLLYGEDVPKELKKRLVELILLL